MEVAGERIKHPHPLTFLDSAEIVLERAGEPLDPHEIISRALDQSLLDTRGLTPDQTMKAKLSRDILDKRESSRFMRASPNHFALRRWTHIPEFVADRFQKALLDEDIVVFDADILREYFPSDGITELSAARGLELVAQTYPMRRSEAEQRFDIIQLVSQFLVVHQRRVATHKRTRRLPEARLHGERSLLFGGHLNPDDIAPLFGPFDPENGGAYITRELSEEVRIKPPEPRLTLLGGIYDPRREVSKQHLGVIYLVEVPSHATIEIGERGFLQQLSFETLHDIEKHVDEFENWSELVYRDVLLATRVRL